MKARIIELKRFAVHDGDGIRTTLFLKGCPLKCVWCHNPEGIGFSPQIAYYENKCIECGECVSACPSKAHSLTGGVHHFDRIKCTYCGKCADACLGEALNLYGKEMSVAELLPILLEDREFYSNSGGGVTISGGECLMHADFCAELLRRLKANGINTAIDTCGYVDREAFDKVLPYTDVFLYDLKAIDPEIHFMCTGRTNERILDNLRYLDSVGAKIELRIPFVPGYNDGEIEKMAAFISELKHISKIRVLPYHNYAGSKYRALDMEYTLPDRIPTSPELECARKALGARSN